MRSLPGRKQLRQQNWADFAIDPASSDGVLLTHAHIDHCEPDASEALIDRLDAEADLIAVRPHQGERVLL